jgi:hypothetical protein
MTKESLPRVGLEPAEAFIGDLRPGHVFSDFERV